MRARDAGRGRAMVCQEYEWIRVREGRHSTSPVWLSGLKFNIEICALWCMLRCTIILFAYNEIVACQNNLKIKSSE